MAVASNEAPGAADGRRAALRLDQDDDGPQGDKGILEAAKAIRSDRADAKRGARTGNPLRSSSLSD